MKAFRMAAESQIEAEESEQKEPVIEFSLGEYEFEASVPTPGQVSIIVGAIGMGGAAGAAGVFRFLRGVLKGTGYSTIQMLLETGQIDFDVLWGVNEDGEEGIVNWLISKASARPTQAQSTSSESSKPGGKKSTGRSPGRGSTLSE